MACWPLLCERFPSLHPRDVVLTPEDGGLTWPMWQAFIDRAEEPWHLDGDNL